MRLNPFALLEFAFVGAVALYCLWEMADTFGVPFGVVCLLFVGALFVGELIRRKHGK